MDDVRSLQVCHYQLLCSYKFVNIIFLKMAQAVLKMCGNRRVFIREILTFLALTAVEVHSQVRIFLAPSVAVCRWKKSLGDVFHEFLDDFARK